MCVCACVCVCTILCVFVRVVCVHAGQPVCRLSHGSLCIWHSTVYGVLKVDLTEWCSMCVLSIWYSMCGWSGESVHTNITCTDFLELGNS